MEITRIGALGGPNIWAGFPVLELQVDLGPLRDTSSEMMPGFNDRLKAWLPSLIEHRCSVGERGGFFQRLDRGTYLAHILEHVVLELQTLAGSEVGYGRARETDVDGIYKVAIEYDEEELARAAVEVGRRICLAAVHDQAIDVPAEIEKLKELHYDAGLGPSTKAIVAAARDRGIPHRRLNRESLVQLGHAAKARRICTAETDQTSAIAETIAQDKQLTRMLLKQIGAPVPIGRPVASGEEAWMVAQEIGLPVVLKPQFGNHGRGVATNLKTREQVLKAYDSAREESRHVLVETFAPGVDHRLLVIGGKLVAAALREPAQVVGDGRQTVRQLVVETNKNPLRSEGHSTVLSFIKLDTIAIGVLAEQGHTPDTVPAAGSRVLIRCNGNLSTGGTAADVTDRVHPEVAARAVEAARIVGLDIAGVDIVAEDIARPLEEQRGAIVEVNAGPGLRMHIQPSAGEPRPVGEAIVEMLFPPGATGRIPIVSVTGASGTAAATRLIAHFLRQSGQTVGMTSADGLYINDRRIDARDSSGAEAARAVLMNPAVEAAVFETSPESILREGLAYRRADIGVVTDLGGEGSEVELLARAMRVVVEATRKKGTVVLNAQDPLVTAMAEQSRAPVIYFSAGNYPETLEAHAAGGGRAVVAREGKIMFLEGARQTTLAPLPKTGEVESVLAAVAVAWGLGPAREAIQAELANLADRRS